MSEAQLTALMAAMIYAGTLGTCDAADDAIEAAEQIRSLVAERIAERRRRLEQQCH